MTLFFFCTDPSTTAIYTLSLHDALPISEDVAGVGGAGAVVLDGPGGRVVGHHLRIGVGAEVEAAVLADRAVVEHALPVDVLGQQRDLEGVRVQGEQAAVHGGAAAEVDRAIRRGGGEPADLDRKSTRLNSSHVAMS